MKKLSITIVGILIIMLASGYVYISKQISNEFAPEAERKMAEMMGISVEELQNQTPEQHMRMMQQMMQSETQKNMKGFLAAKGIKLSTLPEAKESEIIEVTDGDRIELNPTLVRKKILGKELAMYGYNGQIPGPIIKAKQHATITVDVTNMIDMETTIHWHGIRLENKNDGVPGVTQDAIHPDGKYRYTVNLPDEGIYWYHPHVREDIQQDLGLYGNLLVTPVQSDAYAPVNQEEVIVFDDLMLSGEKMLVPYGNETATHPLMGRFGNILLINGEIAEDYRLTVKRGSVVRFFLTNVANTRTANITIDGGSMKLVGSDVGRYEQAIWVKSVVIAPAERYIVDVFFEDDGQYRISSLTPDKTYSLGTVIVTSEDVATSYSGEFSILQTHEDVVTDIDKFRKYFDAPVDKTLELSIELDGGLDHSMMAVHTDDGIEWEDSMPQMNAMMTGEQVNWKLIDADTQKVNMDINWQFSVGDVKKVRIINKKDSAHPMQHPIHFHGQRFLVLSVDGVPNDNLVWKDTVLVPTGKTADILFDISNPGKWMFHCHIAEHLTNGMMGMFTVLP